MSENKIHLRLYVANGSPNSRIAMTNMAQIRERYLVNRFELEVIDLFEEPMRALEDGVMITPLLVVSCDPPIRIVGNLSDPGPLMQALELVVDDHSK